MARELLRVDVARGLSKEGPPVDREKEVIRGFSVVTKGPVESHGFEFDDVTLGKVVELGNKARHGIKARFGHPTMSGESLGTYLGRAKNFRLDGDIVRADLHLNDTSHETPNGDLGGYVLDLAESDPEAFGSSMVVEGKREHRLNEDGTPKKGPKGEALLPLYRPTKLWATDVVDDPAANEGFFSKEQKGFFSADVELSAAAQEFLEKFVSDASAVEKAVAFLERFGHHRGHEKGKDPMEPTTTATPAAPANTVNEAEVTQKALAAERARVKALREAAFPGQEELLNKAIDEGTSVEAGLALFNKDMKVRLGKQQTSLTSDAAPDLPATTPAPIPKKTATLSSPVTAAGEVDEAAAKARWESFSRGERAEFMGDFENYKSHLKTVAKGNVKGSLAEV